MARMLRALKVSAVFALLCTAGCASWCHRKELQEDKPPPKILTISASILDFLMDSWLGNEGGPSGHNRKEPETPRPRNTEDHHDMGLQHPQPDASARDWNSRL